MDAQSELRKITIKANLDDLRRHTTASRAIEQLKKIATARSPVTGTERGVSNREGDTRYLCFTTLCQESIPAALSPRFRSLQCGSNTETDDDCRRRQFSIGKLSVRKLPLQSNNSRRERRTQAPQRAKNASKAYKQGLKKYFVGL